MYLYYENNAESDIVLILDYKCFFLMYTYTQTLNIVFPLYIYIYSIERIIICLSIF